MDEKPSLIERAYQIARSGTCKDVEALIRQLSREGYEAAYRHIAGGSSLRQELRILVRVARARV